MRLASLGKMGAQLRTALESFNTIEYFELRGVSREPLMDPSDAKIPQCLGQLYV